MKQLRGVVMCGGQSRRMGTDKGLIPIQNTCWAKFIADKLAALSLPVSVSINQTQQRAYLSFFDSGELIIDSFDIGGPLNGLLSVHEQFPHDDLLLLACDMISMESETLQALIIIYQNDEQLHHFYTYQNGAFAEPLCAIYTATGLAKSKSSSGNDTSLQKVLREGITKYIPLSNPQSFKNYNTL